jgi:hypothetical protein
MYRKTILSFIISFIAFLVSAQKQSIRVFAYDIPNISGVAPVGEINVGDVIKADGTNPKGSIADYQFYIAVSNMSNITLHRFWLKQQLYAVKIEKVSTNPLLIPRGKNAPDTLVPSTSADIWRVLITSEPIKGVQPISAIRKLVKTNDVVIRFSSKNQPILTATLPKIKQLQPISGS